MFQALLTLGGVAIGGLIGLGGTYLQTRNQRQIKRREELVPIATKVLAAAQESWEMLRSHAVASSFSDQKNAAGIEAMDYLKRHTYASRRLHLSLNELSLLMRGVENESKELLESVRLGTLSPGRQHDDQEQCYVAAREAFQEHIRDFLGTEK